MFEFLRRLKAKTVAAMDALLPQKTELAMRQET